MSIAFDNRTSNSKFESSGFVLGSMRTSIFQSPSSEVLAGDRRFSGKTAPATATEACSSSSSPASSSSSSIGKNSDVSGRTSGDEDCEENEVDSKYKGPLDMMDSLEEVLPIRRGISRFYNGKSKSFTSLADSSSSSSIKDITKPENAYTRKRRNLLAFNSVWDKNRNFHTRSNGGGISKRLATSRSTLALAVAMSSSESIGNTSEDSNSSSSSRSPPRLPPLHPQSRASHNNLAASPPSQWNSSPWRSFSLADLQQCSNTSTTDISCSPFSFENNRN